MTLFGSRRKKVVAAALAAVAVVGGVAVAASGEDGGGGGRPLVITAEAQRRTLTDSVTVKGVVGRAEQRQVEAAAAGHVTNVAIADGTEVGAGSPLLTLDGRTAVAELGDFPFFRPLDVGDHGQDVRQLETILDRAGYHPGRVDDEYTEATRSALAQWQAAHHYPGTTPERAETVTVSLSPSNGYTVGDRAAAAVTIQPAGVRAAAASANPTLSIHSLASVAPEGSVASFRIDADEVPLDDTEVSFEVSGAGDADILAPPGTVTLAAGTWSTTVAVQIRQDRTVEPDERVTVTLVDGSGYDVATGANRASTSIVDDDVPKLTIVGGGSVAEGGRTELTVLADQAPAGAMQVGLSVTGDAVAGRDYAPIDPYVVLPAGATSVRVPVNALTDDVLEDDERIVVSLAGNPGHYAVGPAGVAVVTIAQGVGEGSLPVARIRATATQVKEGQPFPLTLSLDQPRTSDVAVQLGYVGTAREGDDYTPLGRVVVPAGQTSVPLQVPTVADDRVEEDRVLVVGILAGPGYVVGAPAAGAATIVSDDVPELTLVGTAGDVREGGQTTFRIVADQAPIKDISIAYSAVGSATSGQDFDALAGTALLRAGQTFVDVPLLTIADDVQFQPTDMIAGSWPIRVGQVLVDTGESVAPGDALLTLTDSTVTVTLRATASDRTRLRPGQKATVTVSGSTDEVEGVITALDETAQVDEKTNDQFYEGTVDVAGLDAADGANVAIEVVLDQRQDALTVPIAAVKQDGSGRDVVRVLDLPKGGEVREVVVKTGISEGSYIEVESGLEGGEVVIVEVDDKT